MTPATRRRNDKIPDDPARQRMWLFGIASKILKNHYRSHRRRQALTERLSHHLATSALPGSTTGPATRHAIRDAVRRLDNTHRELVMLIHWDGFSITEAAEVLDLNPSNARSRYASARQALREALGEQPPPHSLAATRRA